MDFFMWGDNDVDVWELDFADAQDSNFPQVGAGGSSSGGASNCPVHTT